MTASTKAATSTPSRKFNRPEYRFGAVPVASGRSILLGARLYAITTDRSPATIEDLVRVWLATGVTAIQLRHKTLARGELLELARRLAATIHAGGGVLVVNDHLDIALLSGADGVHVGPADLAGPSARWAAGRAG